MTSFFFVDIFFSIVPFGMLYLHIIHSQGPEMVMQIYIYKYTELIHLCLILKSTE